MKRNYILIHEGNRYLIYTHRAADGTISAMKEEEFEVRGSPHTFTSPREEQFAAKRFQEDEYPTPCYNADRQELTDDDALASIELDPYFMNGLNRLSNVLATLDLSYVSQHGRAEKCVRLAKVWTHLGREAALREREILAICGNIPTSTTVGTPPQASQPNAWFNGWEEGPFSLREVQEMVANCPEAARDFHTMGRHQTYADYCQITRPDPSAAESQAVTLSSPERFRQRILTSWSYNMAASLAAVMASTLHLILKRPQ